MAGARRAPPPPTEGVLSPETYARLRAIVADRPLPAAIVDLDALEHNVDTLVAQLGASPLTIRLATKSVRHPGLIRRIVERGAGRIRGVMAYAAGEAALLSEHGHRELLLAYPIGRAHDARIVADVVAAGNTLVCAVDDPAQVALLGDAGRDRGVVVPLCIDVDASLRPGLGVHLGVRRSPIRSADDAVQLARVIARTPGVVLTAVMAYEAQVAGIRDHTLPTGGVGVGVMDAIKRAIKARSKPRVAALRAEVITRLRAEGHHLSLVNGGGTGSVAWTATDPSVTEVAAGSGFLCPHLFDGYDGLALRPAAWFAIPVVRSSDAGYVTCAGGGYPASGAPGADRLPIAVGPPGLSPLGLEGFGEVQTPFVWHGAGPPPALGDPVFCRHAKAGELAERFATYLLVRGDQVVAEEPTYRGLGATFP